MTMGERIKHQREKCGFSQKELAALTRMRQNVISRLEHGDTPNPGADVLKRLAIALRCSIDYLVGLYGEDHAPPE
ncbi:MAG TPA: helix-turn-helix transcriptional regulator [Candidatus Tectomicrobia bacterium]